MNAFEKLLADSQVWFTCYQKTDGVRPDVTCEGPFKTVFQADKATPDEKTKSTLIPVSSFFTPRVQYYFLKKRYNALFRPTFKVVYYSLPQ